MKSPVHRCRDVERQATTLQLDPCVPPPHLNDRGEAGAMWFVRDACGIVCAIITWFLVFYAEFVVLFVMLLPSKNLTYSIINGVVFNGLGFLALASHFRAMCTDPVSLQLRTVEIIHLLSFTSNKHSYKCGITCCHTIVSINLQ